VNKASDPSILMAGEFEPESGTAPMHKINIQSKHL
jgi:hypothetical protein